LASEQFEGLVLDLLYSDYQNQYRLPIRPGVRPHLSKTGVPPIDAMIQTMRGSMVSQRGGFELQ